MGKQLENRMYIVLFHLCTRSNLLGNKQCLSLKLHRYLTLARTKIYCDERDRNVLTSTSIGTFTSFLEGSFPVENYVILPTECEKRRTLSLEYVGLRVSGQFRKAKLRPPDVASSVASPSRGMSARNKFRLALPCQCHSHLSQVSYL